MTTTNDALYEVRWTSTNSFNPGALMKTQFEDEQAAFDFALDIKINGAKNVRVITFY